MMHSRSYYHFFFLFHLLLLSFLNLSPVQHFAPTHPNYIYSKFERYVSRQNDKWLKMRGCSWKFKVCVCQLLSVYADKVYTNLKSRVNGKIDIPIAFIFIKQSVITHRLCTYSTCWLLFSLINQLLLTDSAPTLPVSRVPSRDKWEYTNKID